MNKLYSVRIIRREDQIVQGIYIKEFFMLSGVYVDEFVLGYDKFKEDNDYVDFNIVLEDGDYLDKLKARDTINIIDDTNEKIDLSSMNKRITYGRKIEKNLMKISKKLDWNKEWKRDFKRVYDAFVESDFAYNDYLTHVFLEQFNDDMKLIRLESFEKCLNMIYFGSEFMMTDGWLPQRKLAYLNCARKLNNINNSFDKQISFGVYEVMNNLHKMSLEDEKLTMGDVLAGLTGMNFDEEDVQNGRVRVIGEEYLKNVLEKDGNNRYSAFIYYILANYYEGKPDVWRNEWIEVESNLWWSQHGDDIVDSNLDRILELYREMKKVAPKNYKMLLKTAMKDIVGKTYEEFFEEVNYVLEITDTKIKSGWATPDDLEYYYKSAELLNKIFKRSSIDFGQKKSENENIKKIRKEFVKSNFMKNFIFDDNFRYVYEVYFDSKIHERKRKK